MTTNLTMTQQLPEVIHVVRVCSYRDGSKSTVAFGSLTLEGLDSLPSWDAGIIGTFTSCGEARPSKRIRTIHKQGGVFGLCGDGYSVGAWLGDTPHKGAGRYSERRGWQWTWTRDEDDFLTGLLAARGELTEWAQHLLDAHS